MTFPIIFCERSIGLVMGCLKSVGPIATLDFCGNRGYGSCPSIRFNLRMLRWLCILYDYYIVFHLNFNCQISTELLYYCHFLCSSEPYLLKIMIYVSKEISSIKSNSF